MIKENKLPIAKRVFAKTISKELVSIRPLDPPPPDWLERFLAHKATKGTGFTTNR